MHRPPVRQQICEKRLGEGPFHASAEVAVCHALVERTLYILQPPPGIEDSDGRWSCAIGLQRAAQRQSPTSGEPRQRHQHHVEPLVTDQPNRVF